MARKSKKIKYISNMRDFRRTYYPRSYSVISIDEFADAKEIGHELATKSLRKAKKVLGKTA